MTPQESRVRSREYQQETFPDAVWFFGDPCPVGARVLIGSQLGTVVKEHYESPKRAYHCQTCSCVQDPPCNGWWEILLDEQPCTGVQLRDVVEYPPLLRKAP